MTGSAAHSWSRRLREWKCSAEASVSGVGRRTWRWWSKPTRCTSLQKRTARYGWWTIFRQSRKQTGWLPTPQSSRWNRSSSSGTSSWHAPYPARGRRQIVLGRTRSRVRGSSGGSLCRHPAMTTLHRRVLPAARGFLTQAERATQLSASSCRLPRVRDSSTTQPRRMFDGCVRHTGTIETVSQSSRAE